MRYGVCVSSLEDIAVLADAGYDFCELPTRMVQPFETDEAVRDVLRLFDAAPLRPESFNVLVPAELPLVGPHVDLAALNVYAERAFRRMRELGGVVAVLGSGAARRIPEGMPRHAALAQLADTLAFLADRAERAGITLALEPLNRGECNVFNTLAESRAFLDEHHLAHLHLLADLHHIELEHESFAQVAAAAPLLAHVHVADGGRQAPGGGGYEYGGFMAALHSIGYDQRISAECSWRDLREQAAPALAFMRQMWEYEDRR